MYFFLFSKFDVATFYYFQRRKKMNVSTSATCKNCCGPVTQSTYSSYYIGETGLYNLLLQFCSQECKIKFNDTHFSCHFCHASTEKTKLVVKNGMFFCSTQHAEMGKTGVFYK
jgi:hypothetical protein